MNSQSRKIPRSLGDDVIEVVNSLEFPSPDEIDKERRRISDLKVELKKKSELRDKFLQKASSLTLQLNNVHVLLQESQGDPLLYALSVLLEEEKAYNDDQASRMHVERENKRLEDAERYLRLLMMKRALTDAVTK